MTEMMGVGCLEPQSFMDRALNTKTPEKGV